MCKSCCEQELHDETAEAHENKQGPLVESDWEAERNRRDKG